MVSAVSSEIAVPNSKHPHDGYSHCVFCVFVSHRKLKPHKVLVRSPRALFVCFCFFCGGGLSINYVGNSLITEKDSSCNKLVAEM